MSYYLSQDVKTGENKQPRQGEGKWSRLYISTSSICGTYEETILFYIENPIQNSLKGG